MVRMRTSVTLVALLIASQAAAQPGPSAPPPPPPAPAPAPSPTPAPPPPPTPAPAVAPQAAPQAPQDPYAPDPVLNEQIAEQLVSRAQELLDAKIYVDAKQLAVEALVKSPKGNSADRARFIIRLVNNALGIKDDPAPVPPSEVKPEEHVDLTPMGDPTAPLDPAKDPPPGPADTIVHDGRIASMAHGAFYGGVIGATVGAFIGQDSPAKVAVPVGIAAGVGTGLVAPLVVKKLDWDEAQVRTAGSFNVWGGVIGGMFGDAVTGAGETDSPTARGVLLGASIGSTIGLAGGVAFARNKKFTRGDVALIDTMAGIGTVGGLTMGMLMQPAQPEAYAVNSILGAAGGIVIGIVAAPNTNTTPRRMLRVAGLSALGGAVPFLLYAAIADSSKSGDEQLVGFLSSAGLVGGAYLGFRLTSGMDAGLDVQDGKKGTSDSDAPPAAVSRNSDGSWTVGAIGMQPLSKQLSPNGAKGMTFTLLGATF